MKIFAYLFFGMLFVTAQNPGAFAQTTTAKIAVGAAHSLVLDEKGDVYSFGTGVYGELGHGGENRIDLAQAVTHPTIAGKTITDISIGLTHVLVLTSEGEIYGWGTASSYELGTSNVASGDNYFEPRLIQEAGLDTATIVNVYAGDRFSMFLSEAGTLFVIGNNPAGYLGVGSHQSRIEAITPVDSTNLGDEKIVKVWISRSHTLLLTKSNKVFGFGKNSNGQLGKGDFFNALIPVEIPAQQFLNKTIVDIAISESVSMFLASDGTLFTCGFKRGGLGIGTQAQDVNTPTPVIYGLDGKTISSIASLSQANGNGNIAIDSVGSVFVSGYDALRRHGFATEVDTAFVQIPPSQFENKSIVAAAVSSSMNLFLASDGTLFGAGINAGTGYTANTKRALPLNTTYLQGKSITKIRTTDESAALLSSDGTLFWFRANKGEGISLGSPASLTPRSFRTLKDTPTKIAHSNLTGHIITDVKAGGRTSYLLTSEGKVFSFGNGQFGTLGNGDSLDVDVPTLLTHTNLDGKRIVDIAVSSNNRSGTMNTSHTLLLADDGTLFSMGRNTFGQLGVGDTRNRFVPTPVTTNLGGKTITKIAVGGENSMAIASDGSVFLWGKGGIGEMGFGNFNNLNVPTLASHANVGGKKIIRGAIGSFYDSPNNFPHFLVLTEDHTLYSFGEGGDGQLGQGVKGLGADNNVPTQVIDTMLIGETIVAIEAGLNKSMLLTQSGKLFGWGNAQKMGFDVSSTADYVVPTELISDDLDGRRVLEMRAHSNHGLALYDDGTVLSFGNYYLAENYGVLGNGPTSGDGTLTSHYSDQHLPTKIANLNTYNSPVPNDNLVLHLDAERLGYSTANDSINTWGNLANTAQNAVHPGLAFHPLRADSAINNRPAMRFNGSNQYFVLPNTTDLGIQSNDYEVFLVAKSSNPNIQFLLAGQTLGQHELHLNGEAGARFIPVSNTAYYVDVGSSGAFTNGNAQLINLQATNTFGKVSVNRTVSTINNNNSHSPNSGDLYLGKRTDSTFFFNGDIAEVIVYNSVLSDADRGRVEDYLYAKYGLKNVINKSFTLTGTEGWRLLANPVADSSFAPLLSDLWTQGFPGAKAESGTPNVFTWDTTTATSDNTNWKALSRMDSTLQPGTAALVYVFSDDNYTEEGDAGFPKTLNVTGIEPLGTQNVSSKLNPNKNGFTLMGNPFRYDIDWDAVTKDSLSNSVYVYDHNAAGWKSWNGTLGSLTDGTIGAYNGFFVQTLGASAKLEIPDSAKTYTAEEFLGKQVVKANPLYFSLEVSSESGFTNKAWFQFSEDGQLDLDASDAHKLVSLSGNYVSVASLSTESTPLDINSLPLRDEVFEIPVELTTTESGKHSFALKDVNFPESWNVALYDSETGERSALKEPYSVTIHSAKAKTVEAQDIRSPLGIVFSPNPAKSKQAASRFILIITPGATVDNEPVNDLPKTVDLQQNYPNPFNPSTVINYQLPVSSEVRLEVFDVMGRKVATLIDGESKSAGRYNITFDARHLASGMYIYRLRAGNSVFTKKLTLIK
ncbi:MAG: T9SS type A sorting domain-containing protein [Balneolaceae bacterium]